MQVPRQKRPRTRDQMPEAAPPERVVAPKHGTWYGRFELDENDKHRVVEDAQDRAAKGVDVTRRLTVADYLNEWLAGLGTCAATPAAPTNSTAAFCGCRSSANTTSRICAATMCRLLSTRPLTDPC